MEGTFEKKKEESFFHKKDRLNTTALLKGSISGKVFSYDIELDQKNRPAGKSISVSRYNDVETEEDNYKYFVSDASLAWNIHEGDFELEESDLSFGSRDDIAGKLKEQAEKMLGKELSGIYDEFTVDEEIYDMAVQEWYASEEYIKCPADFYVYYFYHDIDGFPWKTESSQLSIESEEELGKDTEWYDKCAYSMRPEEQVVSYGKDGIRELSLSYNVECSKVYKKQEILPLDEMLIKIADYYLANVSNTLMKNRISGIKICYISYFSDKEDGKIRNVAKPCWEVVIGQKHYDGVEYSSLYFDASTGEYLTGHLSH